MKTNMKALVAILVFTVFCGTSATATELEHRKITENEILASFGQVFKSSIAQTILKKLVEPSTPSLSTLKFGNLILRVPVADAPTQADAIHRLPHRTQINSAYGGLTLKIMSGQPLSPEDRELLSRSLAAVPN